MPEVRIAVTGLKGSGKTVFLTSLINNLVRGTADSMPAFKRRGVVFHAEPLPAPTSVRAFPYHQYARRLRDQAPEWPPSTENVSEFILGLEVMRRRVSRFRVRFVDYPGERLLDMPLLDRDFDQWSDQTLDDAETPPRRDLGCAWKAACDAIPAGADANHAAAAQAVAAYRAYLLACRDRGLQYLQPSALVLPTEASRSLWVEFCPLPRSVREGRPALADGFRQRYAEYGEHYVRPFVGEVAACSRQVVLVDVLRILRTGLHCFSDAQRCIEEVLRAYTYPRLYPSYDPREWWRRLVSQFQPDTCVERVLFAASKADLATRPNRPRLRRLLEDLVRFAANRLRLRLREGRMRFEYCAACRSTEDAAKKVDDMPLSVLRGRRRMDDGSVKEGAWFPGDAPEEWPREPYDPEAAGFRFPQFLPRSLPAQRDDLPVPNLNLDEVFYSLIEDRVR
jgi:predicted YcjX-like family ATPase